MNKNIFEQWRAVVDYEGLYEVSNLGRVKSVERTVIRGNGRKQHVREQILKPSKNNRGYLQVNLCKNGVTKTFGVHVLVALSFPEICGEYFEGADANHIDENPLNNRADNINWLSRKDNINYGTANERRAKALTNRSDLSKIVYQYDKDTHELVKEWQSTMEVHRQTGFNQGNIAACCNNRFNREGNNVYKGFVWSYTLL